ncbi:hypothetical protein Leryth_014958 [Lithospermum erythrorhizon]|nr:hypothetical protein Leryth_014958 [Lithospermum erythrorhizon]
MQSIAPGGNWHQLVDAKSPTPLTDIVVLVSGETRKEGKAGEFYVVTDDSDNAANPKPGTLRYGVVQRRPLWIIFSRNMQIRLHQELIMQSDKTIDGRGAKVYITGGAGFTLQYIRNVIIHGIHIFNIGEGSGAQTLILLTNNHIRLVGYFYLRILLIWQHSPYENEERNKESSHT